MMYGKVLRWMRAGARGNAASGLAKHIITTFTNKFLHEYGLITAVFDSYTYSFTTVCPLPEQQVLHPRRKWSVFWH
jgi:hypothetical protein